MDPPFEFFCLLTKLAANPMPQRGTTSASALIQGIILIKVQTENSSSQAGLTNSGYIVSIKGIQMNRKCPVSQNCRYLDEGQVDKMKIVAKLSIAVFMRCGLEEPAEMEKETLKQDELAVSPFKQGIVVRSRSLRSVLLCFPLVRQINYLSRC
jgi:hypothetical protein